VSLFGETDSSQLEMEDMVGDVAVLAAGKDRAEKSFEPNFGRAD